MPAVAHADFTLGERFADASKEKGLLASIMGEGFYGHLNLLVFSQSDGVDQQTLPADNSNSNSRFGYHWERTLKNGVKVDLVLEASLGFFQSSTVSMNNTSFEWTLDSSLIRKVDLTFETTHGKFWVGQGSMASDGVAHSDFSGTTVIATASIPDLAGSYLFTRQDGTRSSVAIATAIPLYDGGRRLRLRYDTPSFHGFSLSASAGQNVLNSADDTDYYDTALRYAGEFGAVQVAGAIGYERRANDNVLDRHALSGSLAFKHPNGFNLAFSLGTQLDGPQHYGYTKLGYTADWFKAGATALSVDFYGGSHMFRAGSRSSSVGLAAVQTVKRWRDFEAYAIYRIYDYADRMGPYNQSQTVAVGGRWRF